MKLSYELSKLAIRDLDKIWLFTFENWSKTQANKYFNEIVKVIEQICSHPQMGKSISYIKPNHRIKNIKSHIIIYKIEKDLIQVDRILHKKMDIEAQLKE